VVDLAMRLVSTGQVLGRRQQFQVLGRRQRLGVPGAVLGRVVLAGGLQLGVGAGQVLPHAQLVVALAGVVRAGAVAHRRLVVGDRLARLVLLVWDGHLGLSFR
jgi:hypothetical protein